MAPSRRISSDIPQIGSVGVRKAAPPLAFGQSERVSGGGYQVIRKWLSYCEQGVLGRALRPEEVGYVQGNRRLRLKHGRQPRPARPSRPRVTVALARGP